MITYLCTAGTSISTTLGLDLRHLFHYDLSEWDALQEDIAVAWQFVLEKAKARGGDDTPRISAEINSLIRMGLSSQDRVVLIATETIEGKLCAQLVAKVLEIKGLCSNVDVEVVEGLQARDGKRFSRVGLKNLINLISRFEHQNIVFNPTGGFKSVVPYITLAGMLYNKPVKYIHEFSEDLITLVNLPITFDQDLVFKLEGKLEKMEKDTSISKAEWLDGIDFYLKPHADSLVEEIDGDVTLSGFGLLIWERFKSVYPRDLVRDQTPPRVKFFNLELIEDQTPKNKKANKLAKTKKTHHGYEVILPEANRLLSSRFVSAILNGCNYQGKTSSTMVRALRKDEVTPHLQVAREAVCMVVLKSEKGYAFLIQTTARDKEENRRIAELLTREFY